MLATSLSASIQLYQNHREKVLVQLGANNCTAIVGFNAQLLEYFAVLYPPSVWYDRQIILTQLVSYLSREILVPFHDDFDITG